MPDMTSDDAFDRFKELKDGDDDPAELLEDSLTEQSNNGTGQDIDVEAELRDRLDDGNKTALESLSDQELLNRVADEWYNRGNDAEELREKLNDILMLKEVKGESRERRRSDESDEVEVDDLRDMFSSGEIK